MPGDAGVLPANGDWRTAVTTEAQKHIGVPYVWGAQSPAGWDCSGFILWIFQKAAGVTLPRVAGDQAGVGVNVQPANIKPGDLVFFKDTYAPGISHVGIALGGGRFIHASSLGSGTTISNLGEAYYQQHYAGARRPLAEPTTGSTSGGSAPAINPGVPMPPVGPAVAPAQLMPTFEKAAATTGVPKEILLAIAKVESGFDPRAVGPYLAQFAGTENQHALGMMQFLPSTYRPYAARIDGITGKGLGMTGIWDAESAIYAAAFYLQDSGAPGDMRRALFAYNNADWYVNLILSWASSYAGGLVADPNFNLSPGGGGQPIITVAPENPLQPSLTGRHLDALSSIPLYLPFRAGETWYAGGDGSFYGEGFHNDAGGMYFDVDFNKGTWPRSENDEGEPVLAAADGLINNVYATAGGGWTVEMYHRSPQGTLLRSHYLHLKDDPRISAGIKINQMVPHGTTIGFVGNTGSTSTGAHLHFGLAIWEDNGWLSIRPEPLEGQFLKSGMALVSHNDPANKAAFDTSWNATDRQVYTSQRQSWIWGPQPFAGAVLESYGKDNVRVVQYWDKGRMERIGDGKGGFLTSVGKLAWEMLTGKIDLGNNVSTDVGAAKIPLVGPIKDTDRNVAALALGQPAPDKLAPTYADAAVGAAKRTSNYAGAPINWLLRPGGSITPFDEGTQPPALVTLTGYDEVTGHNVADVFAEWYQQTFLTSPDGDPRHSLYAQLQGNTAGLDPGHPLTDPFWVQVTVDGIDRVILVQIFERWTLTYSPQNPAGWQIELGNVGQHYYEWRYEAPLREATLNSPDRTTRRRRIARKKVA
jgi:hypothetical protein